MLTTTRHPPDVLPAVRRLEFVCPACGEGLDTEEGAYRCEPCAHRYPLHDGIPDFRLFEDPYLTFEEDRERTDYVLAAPEGLELSELLEHYWRASDITPTVLRGKFVESALRGRERARRTLEEAAGREVASPSEGLRILDLGAGTGNLLAEASDRGHRPVGVDIGMRWLHLCRRRFIDRGLDSPPLVCACAEHLPFPGGSFERVLCSATLEFSRFPDRVLAESARVLARGGRAVFETANRYSLSRDPYSYLWGVGYLPRAWQPGYVRMRTGATYDPVHPLSLREVRRTAARHFEEVAIRLPAFGSAALETLPLMARTAARAYLILRRVRGIRGALTLVAPGWTVRLSNPRRN